MEVRCSLFRNSRGIEQNEKAGPSVLSIEKLIT